MSGLTIRRPYPNHVTPEGTITLNGDQYVPIEAFQAVQDERATWFKTLMLTHMHLVLNNDREAAVRLIQEATSLDVSDAHAVASIYLGVQTLQDVQKGAQ